MTEFGGYVVVECLAEGCGAEMLMLDFQQVRLGRCPLCGVGQLRRRVT